MSYQQITKFSSVLSQLDFQERHAFITQRVANGFSREDMAFLLGRPSYHVVDYELLSEQVKMDYEDLEVMASVFRAADPLPLVFDTQTGKHDILERTMIRGMYYESEEESYYQYVHPWTINGVNKPITIHSNMENNHKPGKEIEEMILVLLGDMVGMGYFNVRSSPLMLYHYVKEYVDQDQQSSFLPVLKNAVYSFIHTGRLIVRKEQGHIYLQRNYISNVNIN